MNFELSDEQVALRDEVRAFAADVVAPRAADIDQSGEFPREVVAECGKRGLLGQCVASDLGGGGLDAISQAVTVEELSAACAATGLIVSAHASHACEPLEQWGSPEQQDKLFTPFERLGRELGQIDGTGIGLSIARQLVDKLGGEIGFESEQGKVSCFWVDVPIRSPERAAVS